MSRQMKQNRHNSKTMRKTAFVKIAFILLTYLVNTQTTFGQALFETELDSRLYASKVKLVDEFFDRFNGKDIREDITNDLGFGPRKTNLLLLFNGKMFKSQTDSVFVEATNFVDSVIKDSVRISYTDSCWFAKAHCKGKFRNQLVSFVLYLNTEKRTEDMYKWVIARAEGDVFNLVPNNTSPRIMLMPDDHETNFMSLFRVTGENNKNILRFKQAAFQIDCTSVFYAMVYTGLLKIDSVDSLDFFFLQVPNYVFTIKEFKRETFNSGWLIDSFEIMDDKQKENMVNYIYNK